MLVFLSGCLTGSVGPARSSLSTETTGGGSPGVLGPGTSAGKADPLAVVPNEVFVEVGESYDFGSRGGKPPHVFSLESGNGGVVAATGVFTASATAGTEFVTVTDRVGGEARATITVYDPLVLTPATRNMVVNTSASFLASGGVQPYVYSIQSGGGSIVAATGAYTAGAAPGAVVLKVTDRIGNTQTSAVTVVSVLTINPASVTLMATNSQTFSGVGGLAPYQYSLVSGSGSINSVTGLYTAAGSAGVATVRVTDALGQTADSSVTINDLLEISPTSVDLMVGNSTTFLSTGGVCPCTFTVVMGGGGVGAMTGFYTAPGAAGVATVRVTDTLFNVADASVTIEPALAISAAPSALVSGTSSLFSAVGGVAPYVYSLPFGSGSVVPATGAYVAPNAAGSETVRVTDALGNFSDVTFPTVVPLKIEAGGNHFCAMFTGGLVKCWGRNNRGQLGLGDSSDRGDDGGEMGASLPFVDLGTGRTATQLALGLEHSCALLDDASVKCWGSNAWGELGLEDTTQRGDDAAEMGDMLAAINFGVGLTAQKIVAGNSFTCAILNDSSLKCWGLNSSGQLGQDLNVSLGDDFGEMGDALLPIGLGAAVIDIGVGSDHACAVLMGNLVKCWGRNDWGQLGYESVTQLGDDGGEMAALGVVDLGGAGARYPVALSLGLDHSCAVLDDMTAKCWGRGASGQLSNEGMATLGDDVGEMGDFLPIASLGVGWVPSLLSVGANSSVSCFLSAAGAAKCMGLNASGQLGQGDVTSRGTSAGLSGDNVFAVSLGAGRTVAGIAAGADAVCALLDNTRVKCWGSGQYGKLGNASVGFAGNEPGEMGDFLTALSL